MQSNRSTEILVSIRTECFIPSLTRVSQVNVVCFVFTAVLLPLLTLKFFRNSIDPLPNDKILDWSKFKAFADDKMIVTQKLKFVLGRIENIVGKGENAGYQHFLLSPQCFQKISFPEVLKVGIVR